MFNRYNSYYVKYLLYLYSVKFMYNSLIVKVMKTEVHYHLFTAIGTCVSVSLEDFLSTLKMARLQQVSYRIEVDKSSRLLWFVTLF